MQYSRVVEAFNGTPWAILPEKLTEIQAVIEMRLRGHKLSTEELEAIKRPEPQIQLIEAAKGKASKGRVAVVPVFGVMAQRMGLMEAMSGGVSTEALSKRIEALGNDPQVRAIVLNVDSPGGSVFGVQELADRIRAVASQKRVVAVSNSVMASAAYWISSQANEIVSTPGGMVGSIGVISAHIDESKLEENLGVKTTLITAGKHKAEGHPYGPLSEEDRASIQSRIDAYYDRFVKAVARGRGVKDNDVREGFGEGRMLVADRARTEGLIDRVATLREALEREGVDPAQAAEVAALFDSPAQKPEAQKDESSKSEQDEERKRQLELAELENSIKSF